MPPPPHQVAVAATGRQALEAGLGVAADGGNAVDAALATAFVALTTEPGMVSFGGGAFVTVWPAGGDPVVVDGNVEMPGRGVDPARFGHGVREVVTDYGGGVTMHAGHGSVATPGIVPSFGLAAQRYARLPWARLLEPARAAARRYPMSPAAARYLAFVADTLFADDEEAHRLVTGDGGGLLAGGELRTNDALAETLDELAVAGPDLFTTGAVGQELVAAMTEHGGLVTAADLAAYEPVVRPAHRLRVGDWVVATNPPPSVGGPMLAVMLAELARRGDWTWDDVIEIQRAVLSYRTSVHDFSRDLEADGVDLLARVGEHGLSAMRGSSSTANVSAVDSDGNACVITMSSGYSAGLVIPGTGILLNNSLGELELNRLGIHALRARHPAGVQHGADHRAPRVGPDAGDRLPRRRSHHHGPDARARAGLSARSRPRGRDRPPAAAPEAGRRRLCHRARAGREDRRRGRSLRAAEPRVRRAAHVLRRCRRRRRLPRRRPDGRR